MIETDKSKRAFFKKAAAAVSFVAAGGYFHSVMSARTNSIQAINDSSESEVNNQRNAWLQNQWAPMTDNAKKQMLDEILDINNKHHA